MNNGQKNLKNIFRTLKYRNYRLFFTGQSISLIGTWIQQIALAWLVYTMTGSAFILGLVGFFSRIPTFALAPFAGVIADRFNKYNLLILTQFLAMIQATIITILVFTHTIQIWHIYILGISLGIINAFDVPIRQSFVIEMLDKKEDLTNAIALNSTIVNSSRLIGPTIAGILLAVVGEGWCFLINAVSFIAILGSLLSMKITPRIIERKQRSAIFEFKEGFKYAFGFPPIKYILLLLALTSLMGWPYQVLMPVFAKDILKGGAHSLGFLMASAGIGALVGSLYLASRKSVLGYGKIIAYSAVLFGIGLAAFALSKELYLSLLILPFAGFGMMLQMTSSNSLVQTLTDDDKRGRVMSLYTMAFMGTVPFGNLLAGSLSGLIGVPFTVFVGGICCIIGGIYFGIKLPMLRTYTKPLYIEKKILPAEVS